MNFFIKKLFFTAIFNFFLFLLLLIGIQNSSNKTKVNMILNETIELPISFVVGSSLIFGSILGSFIDLNMTKNNSKSY